MICARTLAGVSGNCVEAPCWPPPLGAMHAAGSGHAAGQAEQRDLCTLPAIPVQHEVAHRVTGLALA